MKNVLATMQLRKEVIIISHCQVYVRDSNSPSPRDVQSEDGNCSVCQNVGKPSTFDVD
jgi:hypothetical protein